jgi:hypothetical protein
MEQETASTSRPSAVPAKGRAAYRAPVAAGAGGSRCSSQHQTNETENNGERQMPLKDIRSVFLPYCVKRQEDGRYAVLNREYKPVGFWTHAHVTYEDHPVLVTIKGLTAARAARISYKGDTSVEAIYLYADGCVPTESDANMTAYLARLAVLAKLGVSGEPPRA